MFQSPGCSLSIRTLDRFQKRPVERDFPLNGLADLVRTGHLQEEYVSADVA